MAEMLGIFSDRVNCGGISAPDWDGLVNGRSLIARRGHGMGPGSRRFVAWPG
jgi:hypothetical protein